MKKRNKGKKTLTAVGAMVAAGLTPGIIAAAPGCLPVQNPNAEITAADVVTIDGITYGFDELYAKQHGDTVETIVMPDNILQPDQHSTLYGAIVVRPYNPSKNHENDDTIYRSAEQMPQFPGGEAALMKYIKTHIKYPAEALKNRIEGRVIVQFVVDKKGKIGEVKVVRPGVEDLDKEAIRVIKTLPKFTPGRQNGQAVSVWYTLPVTFKLPQENND